MFERKQAGYLLMQSGGFGEQAGKDNCSAGAVDGQMQGAANVRWARAVFLELPSRQNQGGWLRSFERALRNATHRALHLLW